MFLLVVPISAPCFSSEPLKPYIFCYLSYTGLVDSLFFFSFGFSRCCVSVTWLKHIRSFCGEAIKTDNAVLIRTTSNSELIFLDSAPNTFWLFFTSLMYSERRHKIGSGTRLTKSRDCLLLIYNEWWISWATLNKLLTIDSACIFSSKNSLVHSLRSKFSH